MRMHKGSVLSPFLFVVVVNVITDLVTEGVLGNLQYDDDLILLRWMIQGLGNKFRNWMAAFECKGLKANFGKTEVMVSGDITKGGIF